MPKQQSRRIAARHHELARRKKARQHSSASAVAEPAAPAAAAAAPTPAPAAASASAPAPAKKSAPPPVAKGPRQILTPDVRYLKSDFLTLALLTSIVVMVLIVLKVMEGQGILLQ